MSSNRRRLVVAAAILVGVLAWQWRERVELPEAPVNGVGEGVPGFATKPEEVRTQASGAHQRGRERASSRAQLYRVDEQTDPLDSPYVAEPEGAEYRSIGSPLDPDDETASEGVSQALGEDLNADDVSPSRGDGEGAGSLGPALDADAPANEEAAATEPHDIGAFMDANTGGDL
jgi:hypothetical protein